MMKTVFTVLALGVSLVLSGTAMAHDRCGHRAHHKCHMSERHGHKALKLTDEQKSKLDALKKEYREKFKEQWTNVGGILTEEQKKARGEAFKEARKAGKKGKELMEFVKSKVNLTDEQKKKKMESAREEMGKLRKEAKEKFLAVLTPEQKEQLTKAREGKRDSKDRKDDRRGDRKERRHDRG